MYLSRKAQARSTADWFLIDDMKACLRRHLGAALIECAALSRDLALIDGDAIMSALRRQFDPLMSGTPVQDCFSDGFAAAIAILKDSGSEPLAVRAELPSGAAEGARNGAEGEGIEEASPAS